MAARRQGTPRARSTGARRDSLLALLGAQRTGTTKPVLGADDPTARTPGGKGFHLKFAFNDTITFPVTLYKVRLSVRPCAAAVAARSRARHSSSAHRQLASLPAQEGDSPAKYAKKSVTLTVVESVDVSGRNPTEVGTIVLNLADFASPDGRTEELKKSLKCSGAVTAVVGDPNLSFSVRCVGLECPALRSRVGHRLPMPAQRSRGAAYSHPQRQVE